jgi:CubicO group peptidase (beta-lactamase class C family)
MPTRRAALLGVTSTMLFAGAGLPAALAQPVRQVTDRAIAAAAAYSRAHGGVSFAAMRAGRLIHEDHPGHTADNAWELASATKSFCGLMAAALVADRRLVLDAPLADILPEWRGDPARAAITTRHLLTLTAGLVSRPAMRPMTYARALAMSPVARPGARFAYGPAPFQVFGAVVRRVTGQDPLDWLQTRLLDPIGVRPSDWRRGADGNPVLAHGAHMTARQMAAVGTLVLDAGRGRGPVVLDPAALAACFEGTTANPGYGLTWWLLRPGLVPPSARQMDLGADAGRIAARADVRMAAGAGNQRLYLLPEHDLAVARQAPLDWRAQRRGGQAPRTPAFSDIGLLEALLGPA